MSQMIELRAKKRLQERLAELLDRNEADPKWWSDGDKLR